MKFLLDTNVISQRLKPRPDAAVLAWMQGVRDEETYLSVVSIQEMRFGVEDMSRGQRRDALAQWLEKDILTGYHSRILMVDTDVADECGRLIFRAKQRRHTATLADALIAATAIVHGLSIATLNAKHFVPLGVDLVKF